MEVLSSRTILHPADFSRSREFYEDILGLRPFHEYGDGRGGVIGVVYFLGGGFLELSSRASEEPKGFSQLWLQVPDVEAEQRRLRDRVEILEEARRRPWGLIQLSLKDPDGLEILLIEVPEDHFLRRDL